MSRPQPYRIDWPQSDTPVELRLATQFESIDQMLQMLFEDLAAVETTASTGGSLTAASKVSMAQVLTRVMVRN